MTTAVATAAPFRLFSVEVVRTVRLTPNMRRVTLGGPGLDGFVNGGRDQRVKLLLPLPGQDEPMLPPNDTPDGWYRAWQRLPDRWRPTMRTYTVRAHRPSAGEIDIDLALHGGPAEGPASRWARGVRPGARIGVCGPAVPDAGGVEFHLPDGADQVLLVGDETALPAVACILESLAGTVPVQVFARTADPADRQQLPAGPGTTVHWLHGGAPLAEAVAAAALPQAVRRYAWVALTLMTVGGMVPESEVADLLRETERAHEGIAIGSYPFFREGKVGANFVVRSEDLTQAQAVADQLQASLESAGYLVVPGGI